MQKQFSFDQLCRISETIQKGANSTVSFHAHAFSYQNHCVTKSLHTQKWPNFGAFSSSARDVVRRAWSCCARTSRSSDVTNTTTSTYVVNQHKHDGLGHEVLLRLVHDAQVRVDEVTNRLDLPLEHRVCRQLLAVISLSVRL